MKKSTRHWLIGAILGVSILCPIRAHAVFLRVFSIERSNLSYRNTSPYIQWSSSTIQGSTASWVAANQFLILQTDLQYHTGNWAIQVFTDNTSSSTARGTFNLPDWYDANHVYHAGGTVQGPLTPLYKGHAAYVDGNNVRHVQKAGLVSADGESRLPLIWAMSDVLGQVPNGITENPNPPCNFVTCNWFYFLDKGDRKLVNGIESSDWTDNFDYAVPLNQNGWKWGEAPNQRAQPTPGGDGTVSEYLFVAANFRNGTRQVYSTTIFVELLTF